MPRYKLTTYNTEQVVEAESADAAALLSDYASAHDPVRVEALDPVSPDSAPLASASPDSAPLASAPETHGHDGVETANPSESQPVGGPDEPVTD